MLAAWPLGVAAGVAVCSNRRSTIIPGAAGAVVDLTVGGGIAAARAEYGVLGEWNIPGVVGAGVGEVTEAAVEFGVCWQAAWAVGRTVAGW